VPDIGDQLQSYNHIHTHTIWHSVMMAIV